MSDPAEIAIQKALIDHLIAHCASPAIPLSLPNIEFTTKPAASQNAYWLRATWLPAPTQELSVDYGGTNQHFGILQVDVFYGLKSGEYAPARLAAEVISWFQRGTRKTQDGFAVVVTKPPKRGPMLREDGWVMIPVTIEYLAFASNPN